MKQLLIAASLLCCLCSFEAMAQNSSDNLKIAKDANGNEYILEIQPGKKVLHTDLLDLAPTTTLREVLDLFPELLSREGDFHLTNYDLQINDSSTSASAENVMNTIFISEIKKIEVSQSPDISQQVNGQGGVIKVVLKDPDEGVSGKAYIEGSSLVSAMPAAKIAYKKDKLIIRASLSFDYYHPLDNNEISEATGTQVILLRQTDSVKTNYYGESARAYLKYQINPKGSFETWLVQDYQNNNNDSRCGSSEYISPEFIFNNFYNDSKRQTSLMINSNSKYKQNWERSGFEASFQYIFNKKGTDYWKKWDQAPQPMTMNDETLSHTFKTVVKGKYQIVPTSKTEKAEMTVGVNCNYGATDYDYFEDLSTASFTKATTGFDLYLSPYVEADCIFGPVAVKAGVNYQYRNTGFEIEGNDFARNVNHNFTANVKAGWQIVPHHHLSALLDRSTRRPSAEQLYPYKSFKPFSGETTKGNLMLNSEVLHTANLNYIFDTKVGEHTFIANVSGQYIRTDNIIYAYQNEEKVINYTNDGFSNIFNANAMLHYNYQIFQIQLTANVFRNWKTVGGVDDTYTYFNLAVIPRLNFPHQWRVFLKLQYYSPVVTKLYELSDYSFGEFNVSKTWKDLTVSLFARDLFHKTAIDYSYTKEFDFHAYNLHRKEIGLSVCYNF